MGQENITYKIIQYKESISDSIGFYVQILSLERCLYIWIGEMNKSPKMSSLNVSMHRKEQNEMLSSTIYGISNDKGIQISNCLARKTDKQCFVTYEIPEPIEITLHVLKSLIRKLNDENLLT